MQETLFNYPNLSVRAASVFDLVFSHPETTSIDSSIDSPNWGTIKGVKLGRNSAHNPNTVFKLPILESGEIIECSQVVICTGTFLSGEIHIGNSRVHFL